MKYGLTMIELIATRRRPDPMHVVAAFVLAFQSFSGRRCRADHCDPASQFPYFPIEPDSASVHASFHCELNDWSDPSDADVPINKSYETVFV
ncbi:hypothetical protein [Paraburkholderia sp. HP33-1]|uniref:hypothetical protein n=1 Tax=Paraburkholderia sp. HP33-1 TaxID=2883243 RepID=UPI001F415898|nr:hypothetical protein [Paraburkholderia sp. HP33-1]